jgi:hypothetical protein
VSEQVKRILKKLLAGRRPGLETVAGELRLSTRTLRRRLTGERARFQQLMEDARRELARQYLLYSSLELNETACLLGYEMPIPSFEPSTTGKGTRRGNGEQFTRNRDRLGIQKQVQWRHPDASRF